MLKLEERLLLQFFYGCGADIFVAVINLVLHLLL